MSKRDLKELERVADAVSNGRSDVRRLAEYAGERGGEQMLNREGRHIPEAFHSVQPVTLLVVAGRSLAAGPATAGMMSCPCLSNDPGGESHRPSYGDV